MLTMARGAEQSASDYANPESISHRACHGGGPQACPNPTPRFLVRPDYMYIDVKLVLHFLCLSVARMDHIGGSGSHVECGGNTWVRGVVAVDECLRTP